VPGITAAPGAPVTVVQTGQFELFVIRNDDGAVSFTSGNPGSFQGWSEIPGIAALPRTPIAAPVPSALLRALFVVDLNGKVQTTAGASPNNWDWVSPPFTTTPGSRVTPLYEPAFTITLFVTGLDGQVYFNRATNLEF
jgi:hypothetical protein